MSAIGWSATSCVQFSPIALEGVTVLIAVGIRLANHDALLGLQINIGEVHILLAFLKGGDMPASIIST